MTRYLITGAGGFVARHLLDCLDSRDESVDVLGLDRLSPDAGLVPRRCRFRFEAVDLLDKEAIRKRIAAFQPDYVVHLAARSSVAASWRDPAGTVSNNLAVLLNLYEAVRTATESPGASPCRILSVGSAEVYGNPPENAMPLSEEQAAAPNNPYAVGRLAQEQLSRIYRERFGLDIVSTRSFMHVGPGQRATFAIASFVYRLVEAKRNRLSRVTLRTGNVDLLRDIGDVRDVVRAYWLLLRRGRSGEIYNVCRGEAVALRRSIERASEILGLEAAVEVDPALLRPGEAETMVGDNTKIRRDTGWAPEIPFSQTIRDMVDAAGTP